MVRQLDVAAIRLVLRTSSGAILEALDELLPPPTAEGAAPDRTGDQPGDQEEIELSEGPMALDPHGGGSTVDVAAGELPAVLRGIVGSALDRRGGALLHAAAVLVEGRGVLCVAPSEGGKTTLCGKVAGRAPVLSDETIALRLDGSVPRISGTLFWSGEPLPTASGLFPLAAICFLRKGNVRLVEMSRRAALTELLHEWHVSDRPGAAGGALAMAETLVSTIPALELWSTLESDPLPLLREAASARIQRAG